MANRFAIIRDDGFTITCFGLLSRDGKLLDKFACILSENTLENLKENLVQYSDQVGEPKRRIPKWNPPIRDLSVVEHPFNLLTELPVADFIHLCNWNDAYAEMCFWNYSQAKAADLMRTGNIGILVPWGVGLIRCSIDLQRAFLEQLYTE
jgi:hypothetical protein